MTALVSRMEWRVTALALVVSGWPAATPAGAVPLTKFGQRALRRLGQRVRVSALFRDVRDGNADGDARG